MPKRKPLAVSPVSATDDEPLLQATGRETAGYIRDMVGSLGQMAEAQGMGPLTRLLAFVEREADLITRGDATPH